MKFHFKSLKFCKISEMNLTISILFWKVALNSTLKIQQTLQSLCLLPISNIDGANKFQIQKVKNFTQISRSEL